MSAIKIFLGVAIFCIFIMISLVEGPFLAAFVTSFYVALGYICYLAGQRSSQENPV